MTSVRHASSRTPKPLANLIADSPHRRLLDQFANIQADLRFREDGIHTTVTLRKKK